MSGLRELSLFTGAGGGLLGSLLLGWEPVQFVEHDPYCQRVLAARFPDVPCHSDVRDFHPVPGSCDVVTGGFPCQPFSQAGKRLGEDDPRNMWPHAVRVLVESGAPLGFFENVPGLLSSGYFGTVLGDLAEAGINAEWCVLGADDVGAPHRRKRLWILASRDSPVAGVYAGTVGEATGGTGRDAALDVPAGCGEVPSRAESVPDAEGFALRPGLRTSESGGERRGRPGNGDSPWAIDPADVPDAHQGRCGGGAPPPRRKPRGRTAAGGTSASCGGGAPIRDPARGERPVRGPAPQSRDERHALRPDGDGHGVRAGVAEPGLGGLAHGLACGVGRRVPRVAVGVPERVARLRALGNGQVPQTMAVAFTYLARQAGIA